MSCDETREHMESCEECRLHVVVEARLRTQPILDPPKGLVDRVMGALPRRVPVAREWGRLAAAAALLVGLLSVVFATGLDRHDAVVQATSEARQVLRTATSTFSLLEGEPWNR